MKIDIKNSTHTKGLVFKDTFYKLDLHVELTEEEKAIIKERDLGGMIIWELPNPASKAGEFGHEIGWNLIFNNLKGGHWWYDFKKPAESKVFQEELLIRLKRAKEYLDENASTAEDTSIEL